MPIFSLGVFSVKKLQQSIITAASMPPEEKRIFIMKKNRFFVFGLMALIFALTLAGCGRADPKTLAQQTYDLTLEIMANPLKAASGMVKAASIGKKVAKLSPADRQIYDEELARLTGQEEGGLGNILGGLIGGQEEGESGILDGLLGGKEAAGILGGLLGGADSASVKEALNAVMEAIGELNSSIKNNAGSESDAKQ
jgi:hypothetical protein